MERLQTGQDRSSTSKVIRLNTVPAGQRYAMVMPSYFSRLSMLNAKKPSPHHDMQGKTILAFRRIVLFFQPLGLDEGRVLEVRGGATLQDPVFNVGSRINFNPTNTDNPAAGILRNVAGSTITDTSDSVLFTQNFGGVDDGASALFDNQGTFRKQGSTGTTTIDVAFTNSGTVEAHTGTLQFTQGIQGTTGTVNIAANGRALLQANSTVGTLLHNGTAASSLDLSSTNLTVHSDYNNANFGTGNSFNARANVAGTGQILAAGTPSQAQVITATSLL